MKPLTAAEARALAEPASFDEAMFSGPEPSPLSLTEGEERQRREQEDDARDLADELHLAAHVASSAQAPEVITCRCGERRLVGEPCDCVGLAECGTCGDWMPKAWVAPGRLEYLRGVGHFDVPSKCLVCATQGTGKLGAQGLAEILRRLIEDEGSGAPWSDTDLERIAARLIKAVR